MFYGSTEAGPATVLGSRRRRCASRAASGSPSPGVDVRLADDGEVCVRGELLMDGYFEQPDATADALAGRLVPHG